MATKHHVIDALEALGTFAFKYGHGPYDFVNFTFSKGEDGSMCAVHGAEGHCSTATSALPWADPQIEDGRIDDSNEQR